MKKVLSLIACIMTLPALAQVHEITTQADFQKYVLESRLPVIIDVYSDTCGPCKRMAPLFNQLSKQYQGTVQFVKMCIQKTNVWAQLDQQGAIRKVPTFIAWFNGNEVLPRLTGEVSTQVFNNTIAQLLEISSEQQN